MKSILNLLSALLFTGLLFLKASAFHVYEHHHTADGQEHHCELCLYLIDTQKSEILFDSLEVFDIYLSTSFFKEEFGPVDFQVDLDSLKTDLFSRPPPSNI